MEAQRGRGRTREINLELYVGRGDHPTATRARLICALAGPDLLGLRAWQLSGHELGADNGGSVGLVHVVQGGGIRATGRVVVKRALALAMQAPRCMAEVGDNRNRSRHFAQMSRQLIDAAKAQVDTALRRLDQARNAKQASWLRRALRERERQPKDPPSPRT